MNRIGEEKISNQGCLMKIVEYNGANDIIVEFQDKYKAKVHTQYHMFKDSSVRNPYFPEVYGIGYIGNSTPMNNRKVKKSYYVWHSMMLRCYDKKYTDKKKTYKDCAVCEEWHNFSNFEKWYNENYYEIEGEKMNLDKDILVKNNKIYSPSTCVFVPSKINQLFRNGRMFGISKRGKYFVVRCTNSNGERKWIGSFTNKNVALLKYKEYKEKVLREVADKYKDKIPLKLYNAIYNWEV